MARVRISEFRAKEIISRFLNLPYGGFPFDADTDHLDKLENTFAEGHRYAVKVDQGIKKRFKQGLIKLDLSDVNSIVNSISDLRKKGFRYFLVEEFIPHEDADERYLALERTREGTIIYYSKKGGIDIEEFESEVSQVLYKDSGDARKIAAELEVDDVFIEKLIEAFDIYYFSFLEINPFVVSFKKPYLLDIAGEVDSAAEFFVDAWSSQDFRETLWLGSGQGRSLTEEELNVQKLSEKSQASFKLVLLNPQGSVFMLLSGGGASIVLADEVHNLGKGRELANYGEYSGNPNEEETTIYTKNVLSLLLKSSSKNKVLIIGGGVANFTDIRVTFKGIINALYDVKEELKNQGIRIFVRRGGPHQKEGLSLMRKFMDENGIVGEVHGPELVLTDIISKALSTKS
jgi:ATP-citrate lyase beta-subunit